jgi:hypothetical protein
VKKRHLEPVANEDSFQCQPFLRFSRRYLILLQLDKKASPDLVIAHTLAFLPVLVGLTWAVKRT